MLLSTFKLPFTSHIINMNPNFTSTFLSISLVTIIVIPLIFYQFLRKKSPQIFLVEFSCYKPPESQKCDAKTLLDRAKKQGVFSDDSLSFMAETMRSFGVGDATYVPENILSVPPDLSLEASRNESEMVIFGAIDSVLAKTKVECGEIGILIVNCTVFDPVPSFCSVIMNRYKLGEGICTYNLTGMGCSSSLLAVCLAKQLLQAIYFLYHIYLFLC